MRAFGIICEYDPFHKGHKLLIDSVRRDMSPDAVVCVMSGDFTQRGEPALFSKYLRAEAALFCGADLVLELPYIYANNSAREFAKGAVSLLYAAGADGIAFGSESGDAEGLKRAAALLSAETPAFKEVLSDGLLKGLTYASSYEKAAAAVFSGISGFLKNPNDTLALEYLKAAESMGYYPKVYALKRAGTAHGAELFEAGEDYIASGSSLRKLIMENGIKAAQKYVPDEAFSVLKRAEGIAGCGEKTFFMLLRYTLLQLENLYGKNNIPEYSCGGEGLEAKLCASALRAENPGELTALCKSKRYTHARLMRLYCHMLTGLTEERYARLSSNDGLYLRVLGLNSRGAEYLRSIKKTCPVPAVSNVNKAQNLNEIQRESLALDVYASHLASLVRGRPLLCGSDLITKPRILQ